ncbi:MULTISPECIES: hypothetical protein [Brucella/Ochrobactrum group]|uniref:Uncharacterized protein n=1 Tax=Brucella tritici TaxID=94626 RepID=A0A6L3Y7Z8_9HYPH|nr:MULTISPECIES: hypothetical protein [Brucella/Ochrobactrum group]KAB2680045.1 hypothetical protein F9L08_21850 [Brucella tritici]
MQQKWETNARLAESLRKIEGLTDDDIKTLFDVADATGMPITDELLPFFATMLSLRREGKNTTAAMKELLDNFQQNSSMMLELEREAKTNFIEELDARGNQELDLAKIKLEAISKEIVGDTVKTFSADIQQKMAAALDEARHQERDRIGIEKKAVESENRRKNTRMLASVSAGVVALLLLSSAVFFSIGYVNGKSNAQLMGSEIAQWAKLPNSRQLVDILNNADPLAITQKCDRAGGGMVDELETCQITIVKGRDSLRLASGTPVFDQIEVWLKTTGYGWLIGISAISTLFMRRLLRSVFRHRWVSWVLE